MKHPVYIRMYDISRSVNDRVEYTSTQKKSVKMLKIIMVIIITII
jgi:hypothetical protein